MCDTFVALPSITAEGSVVFGKNSDREPNEAQSLEYHPPAKYKKGAVLRTTYVTIPQASETHGVLLSRPFWMWGAEIGANNRGVVIGNEAVWTKMPLNKKEGLTGMDLLRLALERGRTAQDALENIVKLLADFGQGGICGYEDRKMVYHNSYIIADSSEAWVLETAAQLWAAKKVEDCASISNGLTIGKEFDLHHPDLIATARAKGWLKKGEPFDFARCLGDWFYTTFSASRKRQCRSLALLREKAGAVDAARALRILRDHGGPSGEAVYNPGSHFLGNRICAHAANPLARKATQSTSSFAANLKKHCQTYWVTGTSAPCTGIFKPVWFDGDVLPDIGPVPGAAYEPASLWWRHEALHREVLQEFQNRHEAFSAERDVLEQGFLREADKLEKRWLQGTAETGAASGEVEAMSFCLTKKSFKEADEAEARWLERIRSLPISGKSGVIYRRFWAAQNRNASMTIS